MPILIDLEVLSLLLLLIIIFLVIMEDVLGLLFYPLIGLSLTLFKLSIKLWTFLG